MTVESVEAYCSATIYAGTLETPPEYCDDLAIENSDYCEFHDELYARREEYSHYDND